LQFLELDEDRVHQLPSNVLPSGLTVTAVPLSHRVRAFGYVFKTPERTGKLDASKAAAAGARGPQLGLLKSGQSVTLSDGKILNANDFLGPSEPGIQVAVIQVIYLYE
jgi:ribonuclease Z